MGVQLDAWIEKVRRCEYLAEDELKSLCEYVSGSSDSGFFKLWGRSALAASYCASTQMPGGILGCTVLLSSHWYAGWRSESTVCCRSRRFWSRSRMCNP